MMTRVCVCVFTDLLHFGIEIYITIDDDELYSLIGDVLIRRLHSYSPDEVHPDQIQALHTLHA